MDWEGGGGAGGWGSDSQLPHEGISRLLNPIILIAPSNIKRGNGAQEKHVLITEHCSCQPERRLFFSFPRLFCFR